MAACGAAPASTSQAVRAMNAAPASTAGLLWVMAVCTRTASSSWSRSCRYHQTSGAMRAAPPRSAEVEPHCSGPSPRCRFSRVALVALST